MSIISSGPFKSLGDLFDEPVSTTIGSFNYFASSYGLEPFKLITVKNSVLLSRFKITDTVASSLHENFYLSILLVKNSISLEDVNDFVLDLAISKRLSHSSLNIYKNVLLADSKKGCNTGKEWAFNQTRLALRLLLSLAEDAGIEATKFENYDKNIFNDVLELDKNKWAIFSVLILKAKIKSIPQELLNSIFGLN